jgi:hypothetical protein
MVPVASVVHSLELGSILVLICFALQHWSQLALSDVVRNRCHYFRCLQDFGVWSVSVVVHRPRCHQSDRSLVHDLALAVVLILGLASFQVHLLVSPHQPPSLLRLLFYR